MFHPTAASFAGAITAEPPFGPPMQPWDYLRLRREAARLSIDDVARRLSPRIATRTEAAALVTFFETRGVRVRQNRTLALLSNIYPFDPGVYRQLAHEPADRHPPVCHGCGSSYWDRERGGERVRLDWAAPLTCSGCADDQAKAA